MQMPPDLALFIDGLFRQQGPKEQPPLSTEYQQEQLQAHQPHLDHLEQQQPAAKDPSQSSPSSSSSSSSAQPLPSKESLRSFSLLYLGGWRASAGQAPQPPDTSPSVLPVAGSSSSAFDAVPDVPSSSPPLSLPLTPSSSPPSSPPSSSVPSPLFLSQSLIEALHHQIGSVSAHSTLVGVTHSLASAHNNAAAAMGLDAVTFQGLLLYTAYLLRRFGLWRLRNRQRRDTGRGPRGSTLTSPSTSPTPVAGSTRMGPGSSTEVSHFLPSLPSSSSPTLPPFSPASEVIKCTYPSPSSSSPSSASASASASPSAPSSFNFSPSSFSSIATHTNPEPISWRMTVSRTTATEMQNLTVVSSSSELSSLGCSAEGGKRVVASMNDRLPSEILLQILRSVPRSRSLKCLLVCRRWYLLFGPHIWKSPRLFWSRQPPSYATLSKMFAAHGHEPTLPLLSRIGIATNPLEQELIRMRHHQEYEESRNLAKQKKLKRQRKRAEQKDKDQWYAQKVYQHRKQIWDEIQTIEQCLDKSEAAHQQEPQNDQAHKDIERMSDLWRLLDGLELLYGPLDLVATTATANSSETDERIWHHRLEEVPEEHLVQEPEFGVDESGYFSNGSDYEDETDSDQGNDDDEEDDSDQDVDSPVDEKSVVLVMGGIKCLHSLIRRVSSIAFPQEQHQLAEEGTTQQSDGDQQQSTDSKSQTPSFLPFSKTLARLEKRHETTLRHQRLSHFQIEDGLPTAFPLTSCGQWIRTLNLQQESVHLQKLNPRHLYQQNNNTTPPGSNQPHPGGQHLQAPLPMGNNPLNGANGNNGVVTGFSSNTRLWNSRRDFVTDLTLKILLDHCPGLCRLTISECTEVTDQGLRYIGQSQCVQQRTLASLHLAGCWRVTDQGLWSLLEPLGASSFTDLSRLGDVAVPPAAGREQRPYKLQLESLDIAACPQITDKGLVAIIRACGSRLSQLRVSDCDLITSVSVKELAKQCPRTRWLDVARSGLVDDECLEALAESCPELEWLNLARHHPSEISTHSEELHLQSDEGEHQDATTTKVDPEISDKAISLLCANCPDLQLLDLSYITGITNKAIRDLSRTALSLVCLTIIGCPGISSLALYDLAYLRNTSGRLGCITMGDAHGISEEDIERIMQGTLSGWQKSSVDETSLHEILGGMSWE